MTDTTTITTAPAVVAAAAAQQEASAARKAAVAEMKAYAKEAGITGALDDLDTMCGVYDAETLADALADEMWGEEAAEYVATNPDAITAYFAMHTEAQRLADVERKAGMAYTRAYSDAQWEAMNA
jgi:aconitase B